MSPVAKHVRSNQQPLMKLVVPEAERTGLDALCRACVARLSDPDQYLSLRCVIERAVPTEHDPLFRAAAGELVAHAVQHGFYLRLLGRLEARVGIEAGRLRLTVTDDGWSFGRAAALRNLPLARRLGAIPGARLELSQAVDETVVTASWPVGVA